MNKKKNERNSMKCCVLKLKIMSQHYVSEIVSIEREIGAFFDNVSNMNLIMMALVLVSML